MNKFSTLILTGTLVPALLPGVFCSAKAAQCAANYEQASALAPKDGYLVFAYAEGWDKFSKALCMKLMKEPAILRAAGDSVLMLMPVRECPTKEQSEQLKAHMGKLGVKEAESYPAILMFGPGGRHYATLCGPDVIRSTPDELAAKISKRLSALRSQNKLLDEARAAKGVEKARLLGAAARVEGISFPEDTLKQLKAADPKDESGYVRSMEFKPWNYTEALLKKTLDEDTLRKLKGQPDEASQKNRLEMEMILKELDAKIADPAYTNAQKQVFCANAIGTLHRKGDVTDAAKIKEYAKRMEELDPSSTLGKSASHVVKAWTSSLTLEEGWKPGCLPKGSTPVELEGKLPIKEPGTYAVTFTYRSGNHALKIKEVRLCDGQTQIAVDAHPGSAGDERNTSGNTYRLKVDKPVASPRLFIIVDMPEKRNSFGTISITRE